MGETNLYISMKVSVVVTVLNEELTITKLIDSLLIQTSKADEIVIVDGGSTDKTIGIIKRYQKITKNIRLLQFRTSRAEARNIGVNASKCEIIATTDAGCIAEKHWLKRLVEPFKDNKVDVVAGFYKMIGESHFTKALSVFLGVTLSKFDNRFLPSARSLAFRKTIWQKVGGFPEDLKDTAEDTMFNYKIVTLVAKIVRVKDAIVYWRLPSTYINAVKKIYFYAKGDAKSGIWWHPIKKFSTHNIKISLIYLRYLIGLYILLLTMIYKFLELPLILVIIFYMFWAFRKVYIETDDFWAGLFGVLLQFTSDIAIMSGFFVGIIVK
jgi:glycosyltransferase involved in cell wall biosynthesis